MKYIPLTVVINEWIRDTKPQGEIVETDLLAWASKACERFVTADLEILGISLLDVKNYKATLPRGFKSMNLAMYSANPERCIKEEIVEWASHIYGSDCDLKVTIECNNCGNKSCTCGDSSTSVLVDVDRLYEASHPGINLRNTNIHHNTYTTSKYTCPHGISRFRLMAPSINNMFNAQFHTKGCPNLGFKSKVEYALRDGLIEVNFKEGQVLLSYMSYPVDDTGYIMIPDNHVAITAAVAFIEERLAYQEYRKTRSAQDERFWQNSKMEKDKAISRARGVLSMLDPDTLYEIVKTHWLKMVPNWHSNYSFNSAKPDEGKPYKV